MNPGEHQSSKQLKRPRFRLEGLRSCTSFILHSYTDTLSMHELRNRNVSILVSCMNTRNLLLYFARFCVPPTPKIANKNLQQRNLLVFITISLYKLRESTLSFTDPAMLWLN